MARPHKSRLHPTGLALVVALVAAAPSRGQAPKPIDARPSCPACDLVVEKVIRLDDPAADIDASAGNLSTIERDSRGRWWVVNYGGRHNVLVFDAQGKLLKKIGRKGAGPGEFEHLGTLAIGAGDTVHAIDFGQARRSVISPTTLTIVRSTPWPALAMNPIVLPEGSAIISSSSVGKGFAYLLHRIDGRGELAASFDTNMHSANRQMRQWLSLRMAAGANADIFTVPRTLGYTIERWSADAKPLGAWERKVDWFPQFVPPTRYDARDGFPPEMFAIWVDSGLVYVAAHVTQPDFKKATREAQVENGRAWIVDDYQKYWDTVIEVFDPATSRLVASKRFDRFFAWQAGKGHLYIKGDDPEDYLEVWRVRLVKR